MSSHVMMAQKRCKKRRKRGLKEKIQVKTKRIRLRLNYSCLSVHILMCRVIYLSMKLLYYLIISLIIIETEMIMFVL